MHELTTSGDKADLSVCPNCAHPWSATTNMGGPGGDKPKSGSMGMCGGCGALMTFDENLTPRLLTEDEHVALPSGLLQVLADLEKTRAAAMARLSLQALRGQVADNRKTYEEKIRSLVNQISQISEEAGMPYLAAFQVSGDGDRDQTASLICSCNLPSISHRSLTLAAAALEGRLRVTGFSDVCTEGESDYEG
jgi:hypothetical protein